MSRTPSLKFLLSHPAHFIALGFGAGLSPVAPGTAGTLVAIPLGVLLHDYANDLGYLAAVVVAFALGIWASDRTSRDLSAVDPPSVVWDEIVAFLLVMFIVGVQPLRVAFGFLLFRFFDIVKLPPATFIDRNWHRGFGVMADDIVAAFYALLVFAVGQRLFT